MIALMRKYFPDVLILLGVFILAVNLLRDKRIGRVFTDPDWGLITGVMLVAVGIDVLVRRYLLKH